MIDEPIVAQNTGTLSYFAILTMKLSETHNLSIQHMFVAKQELKVGRSVGWWGFGTQVDDLQRRSGFIASIDKYRGLSNFQVKGKIATNGMSGAPVTNEKGELIGIVVAVVAKENEIFCTSAHVIHQYLEHHHIPHKIKTTSEAKLHREKPVPSPYTVNTLN